MKHVLRVFTVVMILHSTTHNYAQSIADTIAIENILQDETSSWNEGDAKSYSQHFAVDGTFTNILGLFFVGYEEFLVRHEQIFKGAFLGTKMTQKIVSIRFVDFNVAIVETLTWIDGFSKDGPPEGTSLDEKGRLRTRLLQVMVKDGSCWKIVGYHNVDIKPGIFAPEPNACSHSPILRRTC